jgi:L-lactate dehydrogenase complex protein LldG
VLYSSFKTRAEAVSAEVARFPTSAAALEFIVATLRSEGVADKPGAYAAWAGSSFLDGFDRKAIVAAVPGLTFGITRHVCDQAKFGISQMDWAVAETGTLVQDCSAVEQRLVSTLPQVHMALLPTRRILPDADALWTRLDPATAGYIGMITGPSRTADIERVLTIGVSGPERMLVVAIDDLEEVER